MRYVLTIYAVAVVLLLPIAVGMIIYSENTHDKELADIVWNSGWVILGIGFAIVSIIALVGYVRR